MIPDGTHTAVLDRFEDTQERRIAVLVVEGEQRPLGDFLIELDELPEEARYQNAVFEITIQDEELRKILYEETETSDCQEDAQSRFDRIASRPPSSNEEKQS